METTVEEKVTKLTKPVPIMLEIAEEDRQQADHYCQTYRCLVHTTLERMGYTGHRVYCDGAMIDGIKYRSNELGCRQLRFNPHATKRPYYDKSVVGKQIILYPSE